MKCLKTTKKTRMKRDDEEEEEDRVFGMSPLCVAAFCVEAEIIFLIEHHSHPSYNLRIIKQISL
jgi:hypothetical protein